MLSPEFGHFIKKKGTKLLNIHDQKGFVKTGKKKRSSCSHEK